MKSYITIITILIAYSTANAQLPQNALTQNWKVGEERKFKAEYKLTERSTGKTLLLESFGVALKYKKSGNEQLFNGESSNPKSLKFSYAVQISDGIKPKSKMSPKLQRVIQLIYLPVFDWEGLENQDIKEKRVIKPKIESVALSEENEDWIEEITVQPAE